MKKNKGDIIKLLILFVFIIFIIYVVMNLNNKEQKNTDFKIYFFSVGKADAILINNNDKYIMIDTAEEKSSNEILNYFKENNINTLEYLIITHFDKDHVGSASAIIDNIDIKNVLESNYPKNSEYYNNYIKSLSNKGITPKTITGNYSFELEGMKIIINGPAKIYDKNESNNSSLITKIYYKNNSFLFMGDTENARIKDFVNENSEHFDFIKVPYHGKYLKRMDDLIKSVNPKYAVICSSYEEDNTDTINILDNYNVKTYLTKEGSIILYSDGDNIEINN